MSAEQRPPYIGLVNASRLAEGPWRQPQHDDLARRQTGGEEEAVEPSFPLGRSHHRDDGPLEPGGGQRLETVPAA